MAIKAPPEAKLQVPHPSEGMQIYMQSDRGEIEVFLCPDEENMGGGESGSSPLHEASPSKLGKLNGAICLHLLKILEVLKFAFRYFFRIRKMFTFS